MQYYSFQTGTLTPLFQALLYALRSHSGRLKFSWTRAHANDAMNNTVDLLAKAAAAPGSDAPPLLVTDVFAPPGWVDSGPVLNNQSLAFITDSVVASLPAPFSSPKFLPFFSSWTSWMMRFFHISLDPVSHIPNIWQIHIPVGLRELLYKHVSSSLPIGRTWHGKLTLGQFCRCGSELSLDHLWSSCPSYDLRPLQLTLYSHFISLHNGPGLSAKPWSWSPLFSWYPLIAFRSLDTVPANTVKLRRTLGKSRSPREWALGSFMWYIWKQRMKEVHDPSYHFIPDLHTDALSSTLTFSDD